MAPKPLKLFTDVAAVQKQHPIYQMMKQDKYEPERNVLMEWARGFVDRDGKFDHEFQTTFEPCLWELYLFAFLKEIGASVDFNYDAPDFVVENGEQFTLEATIAAPAQGESGAHGYDLSSLPTDFNEFNSQATLRICNSFTSKVKRYRERYVNLSHVQNKPYVIAIASFDRPFSHLSAMRPVIAALYGLYHDEDATLASGAERMISYNVGAVKKNAETNIDLGYFCDGTYSDVSAVVFSSLATWGKIRALADNKGALSIYKTFHPNPNSIHPIVRVAKKADYVEHLADGLCVFHNPFAKFPLNRQTLAHKRIAQGWVENDGELCFDAPDDFLLLRYLNSISATSKEKIVATD